MTDGGTSTDDDDDVDLLTLVWFCTELLGSLNRLV